MELKRIDRFSPLPVEFHQIDISGIALPIFHSNAEDVGLVWDPTGRNNLTRSGIDPSGIAFFFHFPNDTNPSCTFMIKAANRFFPSSLVSDEIAMRACPWDLNEEFPGLRLVFRSYRSDITKSEIEKIFLLQEILQARTKDIYGHWSAGFSKSKTREVSLPPRVDRYEGLDDPKSYQWVRTSYQLMIRPGYSMIFTPVTAMVPIGGDIVYSNNKSGLNIHIFVIEKK